MYLSSSLSFSLFFCWSGHVFSSLWSNVSKVKSLKDCSLKVFFKCICHCHCICICRCLFVGQVMFSHDPHQFCKVSVWSGRPEGFESITANNQEQSVTKAGIELLGQLKINGWPTMFGYISVCSEGGGGSGLGWAELEGTSLHRVMSIIQIYICIYHLSA